MAGLGPNLLTNKPAPQELLAQLYASTNMLYYDWELTQFCEEGLTQVAQMARQVFGVARLTQTTSLLWMRAVSGKVGSSITTVQLASPNSLYAGRVSGMGLTGFELEVLADWLESPEFPSGLHTFVSPRPPSPFKKSYPFGTTPE